MKARIWLLGPASVEMNDIQRILKKANESFEYVMSEGARVTPENAYNTTHSDIDANVHDIFAINCRPDNIHPHFHMDTSLPGDPGYRRPPREFLVTSAIGRVIYYLNADGVKIDGESLDYDMISWGVALRLAAECGTPKTDPMVKYAYRSAVA